MFSAALAGVVFALNVLCTLATAAVLVVSRVPQLRFLLQYGKTLRNDPHPRLLDLYVPKKWFTHFYEFSLALSTAGLIWVFANHSFCLIHLVCMLTFFQSLKRVYECLFVSKFSPTAKVHVTHYLAGLLFYVWADVLPILSSELPDSTLKRSPSAFSYFCALLALLLSYDQYINHKHLASLKKYTMPHDGLFKYICCAHYFDEVSIYLCHFLIQQNVSSFLVFVWTLVNLSASATQSYNFYGKPAKAAIIPFIY
ncbi:uncharacterized protein OGAPODRAFT_5832 [Ogataea polymorpha]|uniref:uncharacterized protein n=1 Tax=Ogataea polymorpha TaxID=460523 RepID=UPI0007F45618|nr:uncharacterized protein OGAPODRAFT_5832 [Ogataea polymorpha]OBA18174.1 hypothetical protein OGAPODRAFT_5832 [Ogataea polymorpha]